MFYFIAEIDNKQLLALVFGGDFTRRKFKTIEKFYHESEDSLTILNKQIWWRNLMMKKTGGPWFEDFSLERLSNTHEI